MQWLQYHHRCARNRAVMLSCSMLLFWNACSTDSAGPIEGARPAFVVGPETPRFNLEVVLRGTGFGLVKFRQPNDDEFTVYLDVWVRGLAPNTNYTLQRAVDQQLDGNCTSASWLSLGQGLTSFPITTDETGSGRAELFRSVPPTAGATFDIHFRVIEEASGNIVLQSSCYTYTVSI